MGFTKFTKNVLNVSALPDRVQNQSSALKLVFDQAGVDIKTALNALISELEAKNAAANIGADVASVTEKTLQGILTAYENEIANRYTKTETDNVVTADTKDLVADVKIDLATGLLTVTKKNGAKQTFETSTEAESYAVGGTGTRPGEDTDNAKYYAQIAKQVAGGDFVTVVEMEGYAQKKGVYPTYEGTVLEGEVIETETTLEVESSLKLYGNSTQETRSGKNKLQDTKKVNVESNGITFTYNADGTYTVNGTNNGNYNSALYLNTSLTLPAGTYYMIPFGVSTYSLTLYDGKNYIDLRDSKLSFIITKETTFVQIYFQIPKGTSGINNFIFYPMLATEPITKEDYEPYGAMPSPEFESPIMSVSGDVEARVEGSNELNLKSFTHGYCSVAPTLNNGTISVTGSNNADYPNKGASRNGFIGIHAIDEWETGATYYISCDIEVTSNQKNLDESYFSCMLGGEGAYLFQLTKTANGKRYTGKAKISKPLNKLSIEFRIDGFGLNISNFMVSKQETYVYEPYKLTTISLPLGDIELRSTPDGTRDTFARVDGVWNVVANNTSTIFDGSNDEGWQQEGTQKFDDTLYLLSNGFIRQPFAVKNSLLYCDRFTQRSIYSVNQEGIMIEGGSSEWNLRIRVNKDRLATQDVSGFKTWLSANPMEVVWKPATPTYTPITDQGLISALDELEQLVLHKGYNRITVTGVNGVKAQLELEIAPTALTTNVTETEASTNMIVPVVSETGDVRVKIPATENQMTINPSTGVVNVKGLTINGVSLDAYIRSIIG